MSAMTRSSRKGRCREFRRVRPAHVNGRPTVERTTILRTARFWRQIGNATRRLMSMTLFGNRRSRGIMLGTRHRNLWLQRCFIPCVRPFFCVGRVPDGKDCSADDGDYRVYLALTAPIVRRSTAPVSNSSETKSPKTGTLAAPER